MTKHSIPIGVCVGIAGVIFLFVVCILAGGEYPKLAQGVTVILACVGCVSALDFGVMVTFKSKSKNFGDLSEHRAIMALGSFAVMWVSVQSIIQTVVYLVVKPLTQTPLP